MILTAGSMSMLRNVEAGGGLVTFSYALECTPVMYSTEGEIAAFDVPCGCFEWIRGSSRDILHVYHGESSAYYLVTPK